MQFLIPRQMTAESAAKMFETRSWKHKDLYLFFQPSRLGLNNERPTRDLKSSDGVGYPGRISNEPP